MPSSGTKAFAAVPVQSIRRGRRVAWLLLTAASGLLAVVPVAAQQAAGPDAATRAAMERRTAARTNLSSALARIAANGSDSDALLNAGRASIQLEDYRSALGFLARAEQLSPTSGPVKAALGSVMVRMENPQKALDYFAQAQLQGAPERLFLSDRALARDLLGEQPQAQRDYQLALSLTPDAETTRRYALSLGISGETDRAVTMLVGQLRDQDRGAWRSRAMILAMNGRNSEAIDIVKATMPPTLATSIIPYLVQMDRLTPAQQAAAAHFGRFPSGQMPPAAARPPQQIAVAAPPPTARGRRPQPSTTPPAVSVRAPSTSPSTVLPGATRPVAKAPVVVAAAPVAKPPVAQVTPPPTRAPLPSVAKDAPAAAPSILPPATIPVRVAALPPVPSPVPSPVPTASAPAAALPPRDPPGSAANRAPIGPGFSIASIGVASPDRRASTPPVSDPAAAVPTSALPSVTAPAAIEAASPAALPPAAAPFTPAAPLASLADIVSSIEIPAEEMTRSAGALDAAALEKLQADNRRALAADAARKEKEAAAAKAKADTDAKAKAEAAEKKANPARSWVQIATGTSASALASDYRKFAKKYAASFKGQSGATAEWNRTRRLLVGPFKDGRTASAWLAAYKKAGGDGFTFNSEAGQSVDPIK